jgi:iron-sulfur cluster repair protein YtfE (RIC family)
MSATQALPIHHKHCDDLFAEAEASAQEGNWAECGRRFDRFLSEMEAHFATEEEVLFPAFEAASGMTGGPTQMMRFEHAQMRSLLAALAHTVRSADANDFAGVAETLLIMMQQHNMKEESILYPMCDRMLANAGLSVESDLQARTGGA